MKDHDKIFEEIVQCIEANYSKASFNISRLAKQLQIRRQVLWEVIQQQVGMSPKWYLETIRLEQAISRLPQARSLPYLAVRVGYVHYGTLFRAFERRFGMKITDCQEQLQALSEAEQEGGVQRLKAKLWDSHK
jgi:transcriptional regulator GlxA family with amidase domain